ncbi:hypothetical protein AB0L82_42200 [Nocardia sp. NPDC052001]|uniref:hypothetical protein n=1 Tax=unclassified Nocardia TaxID=2637762 RepID=UPI003441BD7E
MGTETSGALKLMAQILSSYSSLEEFLAHLRSELDAPTQELPRIDFGTVARPGRHAANH